MTPLHQSSCSEVLHTQERAKHTPGPRRHMMNAAIRAAAVIDCLEAARAEPRRHVAFWWLELAASNRRHYAASREAIAGRVA